MHPELLTAVITAYESIGLHCSNILLAHESQGYGACSAEVNGKKIEFRVAKQTPKKVGQFVTIWKRIDSGPIMPYDMSDQIDFFMIIVRRYNWLGQFIFHKEVLQQKGFVSRNGNGGKLAMRVYPPWDIPTSAQAKATQTWQMNYFVSIAPCLDHIKITTLLH